MGHFSYITRGDSSPHGKTKVCLLCHPDDLDRYLGEISRDIFMTQNCSIWYMGNNQKLIDAEFELSQMQLVVIPVTKRLLSEENDALTLGLPFAIKNRIPILPILVESGLDALFAAKIGDLEYIDKTSIDLTAISYTDKLAKYLESALLNDEQIVQIKDAFDAYIFLSYRKKDRTYAQDLMRLIHQNDFCEKVAIWYDEFLTPGESFNESIKNALKNSDLFSLVVTPNLVNEKNYIMDVEYPLAQKENKTILPVVMVDTPVERLKEIYNGIPTPIVSDNTIALANALKNYLSVALNSNKDDPVHSFFVGLAYLSGIDVEVDRDRAYKLISAAAEAGLSQAMKKLVHMYLLGDGIEKNVPMAIEWQKRLIWKLGDIAEKSRKESDALDFLTEQMYLAELAYSIEDYERAEKAGSNSFEVAKMLSFGSIEDNKLKKAKTIFTKKVLGKSRYFDEAFPFFCKACRIMLNISYAMGIHEEINKWTKKSLRITKAMQLSWRNSKVIPEFFLIASKMGYEATISGNLSGAKMWLDLAAEGFEELSENEKTLEIKYSFSFMYNVASEYHINKGEYLVAYKCQEERAKALQSLSNEFPDSFQIRCEIINCSLYKGRIAYLYGDLDSTLSDILAAKELITKEILNQLGALDVEVDVPVKNLIDGERGKGVNRDLKLSLAKYYLLLGLKEYSKENYDNALFLLKDGAYGILEPLLYEFFDAEHAREAVTITEKIGDCYSKGCQYNDAYEWHLKALEYVENVLGFSKLVRDSRRQAVLFEKLLDISIKLQDPLRIAEWNEKAMWLRSGLVNSIILPQHGFRTAQSVATLAEKGKIEIAFYREDVQALEKLTERQSDISMLIEQCSSSKDTLIQYVKEGSNNSQLDLEELSKVIHIIITQRFVVRDLGLELHSLEAILKRTKKLTDIIDDDSVSIMEVKRVTKTIYKYYYQHLKPFSKYDEEGMLIASFCGFINMCFILIGDKAKATHEYNLFLKILYFGIILLMRLNTRICGGHFTDW